MYKTNVSDPNQKYRNTIKKLNFLIVDDDQSSRESLRDMLKTRGHNVTTLDEGMKCVNRCSEHKYDIIFMDYHMDDLGDDLGEINGTTVTKIVRDCFDVKCDVYAYTGDNSLDAIKQFKENNMKGVFVKPVDPSLITEFLKIIEKNIEDQIQLSKLSMKRKNFMFFKTKTNSSNHINRI
jgi:two-component system, sensor histidine kinase